MALRHPEIMNNALNVLALPQPLKALPLCNHLQCYCCDAAVVILLWFGLCACLPLIAAGGTPHSSRHLLVVATAVSNASVQAGRVGTSGLVPQIAANKLAAPKPWPLNQQLLVQSLAGCAHG